MSMARVVITAVVVEGRPKSAVARDYGVSRRWVQKLTARYLAEGEAAFGPRSRRPHTSPRRTSQAVEDAIVALRKELAEAGHDAGAETIAWHLRQRAGCSPAVATIWRILSRRVSSPRSRTSGPALRGAGSRPICRMRCGRLTSPTGRSQAAMIPRSSTSLMTIPGCWPPPPPGPSSKPATSSPACTAPWPDTAARRRCSLIRRRVHRHLPRPRLGRTGTRAHRAGHRAQPLPALPPADLRQSRTSAPDPEKLAGPPGPAATISALQAQLDAFTAYYNTRRPHRAIGRRTPQTAWNARPRAIPARRGIRISEHFRVRRDRVDADGKLTLRHNSRLHHIGIGRRWSGTKVLILARDLELRIITQNDGELIRELTLDPTRDYQAQTPKV
jgi:Homeodomain-like domain/Integrase core domain